MHGEFGADMRASLPIIDQQFSHQNGDVTEINIDRAGGKATVTDRAVIRDIVHFIKMCDADTAPGLLLV